MATQFSAWTLFWAFLGLMMLLAGTARDVWVSGNAVGGRFGRQPDPLGDYLILFPRIGQTGFKPRKEFGSLDYLENAYDGYGYGADKVCPHSASDNISASQRKIERVSAGMIGMIMVTMIAGLYASISAILAATNSVVVVTLKPALKASVISAVLALITWALWLRAHWELKEDDATSCRYRDFTAPDGRNIADVERKVGGSFSLYVIGMAFYVFLAIQCQRLIKKYGENSPASSRWLTILLAIIAFVCILVGSSYNSWTTQTDKRAQKTMQDLIEVDPIFTKNDNRTGAAQVRSTIYANYGVYTAQMWASNQYPYAQDQSKKYFCPLNEGLDSDGSAESLKHGGRITVAACVFGMFFATIGCVVLSRHPFIGFSLILASLCCVVIALIVWAVVPYYIIQLHCCAAPECWLGPSFGLVSGSGVLFFLAVYHQAWVSYNDVYVIDERADLNVINEKSI